MTKTKVWDEGVGSEGLKFFSQWLPPEDADRVFQACNKEGGFPWNEKPQLYGEDIPQHAYLYQRSKAWNWSLSMDKGKEALEILCQRIAKDFGCSVYSVYCNRFRDPDHKIAWHQDQFASHIVVLSLGGYRGLEFRVNDTREILRYDPMPGDLYFMSLQHNKKHFHRVLSAIESGDTSGSTRISFVFFISAPFNKREYQVGWAETMLGSWNSMLA